MGSYPAQIQKLLDQNPSQSNPLAQTALGQLGQKGSLSANQPQQQALANMQTLSALMDNPGTSPEDKRAIQAYIDSQGVAGKLGTAGSLTEDQRAKAAAAQLGTAGTTTKDPQTAAALAELAKKGTLGTDAQAQQSLNTLNADGTPNWMNTSVNTLLNAGKDFGTQTGDYADQYKQMLAAQSNPLSQSVDQMMLQSASGDLTPQNRTAFEAYDRNLQRLEDREIAETMKKLGASNNLWGGTGQQMIEDVRQKYKDQRDQRLADMTASQADKATAYSMQQQQMGQTGAQSALQSALQAATQGGSFANTGAQSLLSGGIQQQGVTQSGQQAILDYLQGRTGQELTQQGINQAGQQAVVQAGQTDIGQQLQQQGINQAGQKAVVDYGNTLAGQNLQQQGINQQGLQSSAQIQQQLMDYLQGMSGQGLQQQQINQAGLQNAAQTQNQYASLLQGVQGQELQQQGINQDAQQAILQYLQGQSGQGIQNKQIDVNALNQMADIIGKPAQALAQTSNAQQAQFQNLLGMLMNQGNASQAGDGQTLSTIANMIGAFT